MQYVKTFYEDRENLIDMQINDYLKDHQQLKIEMISSGSLSNTHKTRVFTTVVFNDGM